MILTIANTKGGVGKSTLAVNIAVERARLGKRVWLVDGDRQGSSQTAILIRSEAGLEPGLACSHFPDGPILRTQVLQQKSNFDEVIIECGGRDSTAMRAALTLTDILVVPFVPGSFEVWAMEDVVNLVRDARSVRDGLTAFSLLNRADPNPRSNDNADMLDAMREYNEDIQLLDHTIRQRKVFAAAAGSGRSVSELKLRTHEKAAKTELDTLVSILF
ncbi:AAA family ATPase (plasmid) [Erwinia tracheiphila]|uniref:Chromosome partitioning protein ParA n=1 Tax=Erwinia tracheiphila TaxID=65700 RepID=A0A0M2K556_9GAMM|nr:AAA family ATPase [Erwinia tracheiphila]AXF79079.1 chromosome partitioning protein ParA [Erwinia tracheiphila]EOS92626.1 Cobyrinic acid ac-diamide synthase [Erwinia tracheiphila PSU-1]KKF34079.1 chromosome partitioning protein ParA [Erwinia tracheiphila]UIA86038.1 AAA family ATPase [Erwinia tracheiphila]UIA90252.1 AAA family ATPase [Erwinia tracheiphila]